jgi:pimeloyl-ACP methyl ester carboxylesterase
MSDILLKSVELPNGETLGYRERKGEGPILLLIHGNMNSSKHWDLLLEKLDSRLHLVAVDLRGFGISTYNRPVNGLDDFVRDVKQFVDVLNLGKFSVIGWSTGGGVAMQFAAENPEQVEKLIVLSSVSTRGYPFFMDGPDGQADSTRRARTLDEMLARSHTKLVGGAGERRDRAFMKWLFDAAVYNVNKPDEERYEEYLDDILTQRNLAEVYHGLNTFNISNHDNDAAPGTGAVDRITAPVLVLWGKQDLVITESMTQELMEDFGPRAKLVAFEECGHSVLVDALPHLVGQVERFVLDTP